MKIGMIVAMPEEIAELLKKLKEPATERFPGYEVMRYSINGNEIFVTGSGIGEIASAGATQMLITHYGVEMIINFGVVGGLTEDMKICSTVLVKNIVHYNFDISPFDEKFLPAQYPGFANLYIPSSEELLKTALEADPSLRTVTCASGDRFVNDSNEKKRLHETYGADICEMEAAGILITAQRNNIPALFVKAVSDSVDGGAEEFNNMVHNAAQTCVRILLKIFEKL